MGLPITRRVFLTICLVLWGHTTFFGPGSEPMNRNIAALSLSLSVDRDVGIDRFVLAVTSDSRKFGDTASFEGHYRSGMSPGTSLLLLPVALVSHQLSGVLLARAQPYMESSTSRAVPRTVTFSRESVELLLTQLLGTVMVLIPLTAWSWARLFEYLHLDLGLGVCSSLWAVFAGALASCAFFYSTFISSKQVGSALGLLAFCFACQSLRGTGRREAGMAGFFMGAAVAADYVLAINACLLTLFVLFAGLGVRRFVWFLAGGLFWVVLLGGYHQWAFGSPFANSYQLRTAFSDWRSEKTEVSGGWLLPLYGMTLSTYKGIFVYSPWMLLGLAGLVSPSSWKEHLNQLLYLSASLLGFLVFISSTTWWPSGGWGMRYLLPGLPALAVGLALFHHRYASNRAAVWGLRASVVVALIINYLPFGAPTATTWDPHWSQPILYVLQRILRDGFCLYPIDFFARNISPLGGGAKVVAHLCFYALLSGGLYFIWRAGGRGRGEEAPRLQ